MKKELNSFKMAKNVFTRGDGRQLIKTRADQEPQIWWTRNSQGIGSQRSIKSPTQS